MHPSGSGANVRGEQRREAERRAHRVIYHPHPPLEAGNSQKNGVKDDLNIGISNFFHLQPISTVRDHLKFECQNSIQHCSLKTADSESDKAKYRLTI